MDTVYQSVMWQSGGILFREGLEAMLIIAALAAFLYKAKAQTYLKALYGGAVAAIFASLVAAFVFISYFDGAHDDRLEAVVMITAAALMLYVSGWMFLRQNPRAWKAELEASAQKAISSQATFPIAMIAFLAVFREGAETILFLHALAATSGGWGFSLVLGLIIASVVLIITYIAIEWLAFRLPLRPLFLVTSAFLFIMGLKFIGGAIQELQEQAIVSFSDVSVPQWLLDLGVNPSWEAIGTQLVVALIAIAGTMIVYMSKSRTQALTAAE